MDKEEQVQLWKPFKLQLRRIVGGQTHLPLYMVLFHMSVSNHCMQLPIMLFVSGLPSTER